MDETPPRNPVRLAAVGDIHCTKEKRGELAHYFAAVNDQADVLLLCGDLTDYGLPDEAVVLAKELSVVRVPMLAVLGNHDFESDKEEEVTHILSEAGIRVLHGDGTEILGVGFAGAKGFAGGFDKHTLGPWGEGANKRFVQEAIDESLKLESALARLRTDRRVAIMHYAPIRATVEGEPLEIYPFLGCSRLEEPLKRYPVDAVFHGHAHRGQLEGRTSNGTPVYNVALPLLRRTSPQGPFFRVVTLE
jgi:Icc-related predicted phosphoesterase